MQIFIAPDIITDIKVLLYRLKMFCLTSFYTIGVFIIMKNIVRKLIWLLIYVIFNAVLFFIEISILFNNDTTSHRSNSGFDWMDKALTITNSAFSFLEDLAFLIFSFISAGIMLVAFLIYIPIQIYVITPKYKEDKKRFLYSLLASFSLVIILKLIVYAWALIDINYL